MRRVTADEAVKVVRSGDTVLTGGSGGGHAVPEALMAALGRRFLAEGEPRDLTSLHPVGLGDDKTLGAGHFAHVGMLKRVVCGTLVNSPRLAELAYADKVEAYTFPQGALSQLTREMAAGRPGLITQAGLHTFVDPRIGGGRQSPSAPAAFPTPRLESIQSQSKLAPAEKLGTGHGMREASYVQNTQFDRLSSTPNEVIRIRYDSFENLVAMGVVPARPVWPPAPNPFPGSVAPKYVPDPPAG